jgi:tRNA 5-methylaminomethyl-2-thiouridine biosynthesis bifunctional protein
MTLIVTTLYRKSGQLSPISSTIADNLRISVQFIEKNRHTISIVILSHEALVQPTPIEYAQLDWNEAGNPVSQQFDDVYFSNANGLEETRYVFLKENDLPQRWENGDDRRFVIAETGFGTGLNFLATWQAFETHLKNNPNATTQELHFISVEKFPITQVDLIKAHLSWPELQEWATQLHENYPPAVAGLHRILLANGKITLDLWFGDIADGFAQFVCPEKGLVDAWFLDGFAPSKNLAMWHDDRFKDMARLSKQNGTVATFTAAGFVRRGLIAAGFDMKKVKGFGTKREMIRGTLNKRHSHGNIAPYYDRTATDANDIAIIGGGIASLTTALALLRRGRKVTLYCQDDQVAQGASGNRQGALYPLISPHDDNLTQFFISAFLFARQTGDHIAKVAHFDHDWCGVTQLAYDEKSRKKLDNMLNLSISSAIIAPLDATKTEQVLGLPTHHSGIFYPLGGWLCPQQLTEALLMQCQTFRHFTLHLNTKIEQLVPQNTGWSLIGEEKTVTHQAVILANGHQFAQFSQTSALPATPVRGQVSHIPTNSELAKLKTVLCYNGYMTPVNPNNAHHCLGASHDRHDIDVKYHPEDQLDNKVRLETCIPNVDWPKNINVSEAQARVGVRCVTRDHLPFVGNVCVFKEAQAQYVDLHLAPKQAKPLPNYENLYTITGLGARGLCSAPLLGELLASQLCGDPLPVTVGVLNALHPARLWVRKWLKGKAIPTLNNPK